MKIAETNEPKRRFLHSLRNVPKMRFGVSWLALIPAGFDFRAPFPVSIQTQKISGGPSAGLMFTLTIYKALSSRDLTGGRRIAGTGTISIDGTVGPIGGVKQKVAAAEAAGALYFLCPAENYADAVAVAKSIRVIKVANVQDALNFLNSLPPGSLDPHYDAVAMPPRGGKSIACSSSTECAREDSLHALRATHESARH